jgi:hypothetical protein
LDLLGFPSAMCERKFLLKGLRAALWHMTYSKDIPYGVWEYQTFCGV